MIHVHLDERTEPRDEEAICPACGYHRDFHDDGNCPPIDGISGLAVVRRERTLNRIEALIAEDDTAGIR